MCGIAGLYTIKSEASLEMYDMLLGLQHRGQDAAGMVSYDGEHLYEKKGTGLVTEIFSPADFELLRGGFAIGHTRYRTAGTLSNTASQPFFSSYPNGIYAVHNGNITNCDALRVYVKTHRRHLVSDSDSELLLAVFAYEWSTERTRGSVKAQLERALRKTMSRVRGSYACIYLIHGVGMLAYRDTHGIRPLVIGRREYDGKIEWAFASESCALSALSFTLVRDVAPGEMVLVDLEGKLHSVHIKKGVLNPCIFEYVYLARPDSVIDEISVYKTRLRLGTALGENIKARGVEVDVVIPIPDTSRPAAQEIAHELGVPHREGIVKNRYVGRTFIMPTQRGRAKSVQRKLSAIPLEFKGKRVLLVDDSIVRGTTITQIVAMCRRAGATEVHVASTAPEVRYQNVYGINIPTKKELVAHGKTVEEIRAEIGADGLYFQTVKDLIAAARVGNPAIKRFEDSVFTGKYVDPVSKKYLAILE